MKFKKERNKKFGYITKTPGSSEPRQPIPSSNYTNAHQIVTALCALCNQMEANDKDKSTTPVSAKKHETGPSLCWILCSQVWETNHLCTMQVQQAVATATANFAVVDSGADTCLLGEEFHIIHQDTIRMVEVLGFNDEHGKETGKNLGSAIYALDLPSNEIILLQVNEGVVMQTGKTLLSINQVCHFDHVVDDCPCCYRGKQAIIITYGQILLLSYHRALCRIALQKPTKKELESYIPEELTNPWSGSLHWNMIQILPLNTILPVSTRSCQFPQEREVHLSKKKKT